MQKEPPKAYAQMIKDEQDQLVLSYMPALRAMAFRLKERLPSSIDVNDLISIGVEEMIKLSRRYDKEQMIVFGDLLESVLMALCLIFYALWM